MQPTCSGDSGGPLVTACESRRLEPAATAEAAGSNAAPASAAGEADILGLPSTTPAAP